jgi:hypothetical protein
MFLLMAWDINIEINIDSKNSKIIFQYRSPNKMHMVQSLFYLTTALHVSGVTITHLQGHRTTATTASGNGYTILLFAAIVEDLGLI